MLKQQIIVGNTVTVEKGGEVIPKVTGNTTESTLTEDQLKIKVYEGFKKTAEGAFACPCALSTPLEKETGIYW
jgi:NAD-dependent DNA ligase